MCVWYVILEHEDKNTWAELIWRLLIATMKTFIFLRVTLFSCAKTHHNIHMFVSFDRNLNLKTGTERVELIWRLDFMCIFSPLSNTVYEWVEWMWRMSEQSGVDVEN